MSSTLCQHVRLLPAPSRFLLYPFFTLQSCPPTPPRSLLSHPSPGSPQHGENPSDSPISASPLQPAVQGSDSE